MKNENQFQKKGEFRQFAKRYFKKLGGGWIKQGFQFVPLVHLADVPGIHVLADHNAVDAHVLYHDGAVAA